MKIAFFLDNSHLGNIDFSKPELGNPGTGAGTYLHAAIPYFLSRDHAATIDAVLLAPHTDKLPPSVPSYQVTSIKDAADKAKSLGADYFVFRPRRSEEDHILDHLDAIQMPAIGRAALTPTAQHLKKMAQSKYFKALVCVGREQYDYLIDSALYPKKLAYIDNGIVLESCGISNPNDKDINSVVYMGALVPMKGFHVLAEAWPKVLSRFPKARLSVIGSVKIYGDAAKVGLLGVAEEDYERTAILPYLCDENGRVHPSVTFHGQLGQEKFEIMKKALIGVANPTGKTETCCVSAVEMAGCKTAVVSGAYYALLDTVIHKKTGLLGRGVDDLADNICRLLGDPDYAKTLGEAGYRRVKKHYDFSEVIPRWVQMFEALDKGHSLKAPGCLRNIRYHYKFLRLINFIFQQSFGRLVYWPSVFEWQDKVSRALAQIKAVKK